MRIVQLTPGAGDDFYCENCLRDHAQVRAMRALGHDALTVPLYLPTASDAPKTDESPVFFGGVNVFLQQKSALFRRTPRWIDRLLDSPRLLRWAGRRSGMTSAALLGETTLSMLRGEDGRQAKELHRLIAYLQSQDRPDVVCLSNALLAGVVGSIRRRLAAPVVCMLQDEDAFLDGLGEPYDRQCWDLLRRLCQQIDAFVSASEYYAEVMRQRLALPREKLTVIPAGIDPAGYEPAAPPATPAVGFLSRMCYGKGLDTLVKAFVRVSSSGRFPGLRLRASGGRTDADADFLNETHRLLAREHLAGHVELVDEFDRAGKIRFLHSISVLSVPTRLPEASYLYALEALAAGVPLAMPAHGAIAEVVEATGGGVLCQPNDDAALAAAIEELLADSARARKMGLHGREVVLERHDLEKMAAALIRVFESVASARAA
jgi:glycosyltransferase involved in cell wall biosynthesis